MTKRICNKITFVATSSAKKQTWLPLVYSQSPSLRNKNIRSEVSSTSVGFPKWFQGILKPTCDLGE